MSRAAATCFYLLILWLIRKIRAFVITAINHRLLFRKPLPGGSQPEDSLHSYCNFYPFCQALLFFKQTLIRRPDLQILRLLSRRKYAYRPILKVATPLTAADRPVKTVSRLPGVAAVIVFKYHISFQRWAVS